MAKRHATDVPIDDLLTRRWSPRAFADKPVEPQKLGQLFEAARWSASCFNAQPWRFIVTTKDRREDYQKMLSCLVEKNRDWAKNAPVLVIGCALLNFPHNGKPNKHARYDLGQAVAHLSFEATSQNLFLHQMAGFDPEKARETYSIPAEVDPVVAIAIGYLGDASTLPDDLRKAELAEGKREPANSFVFHDSYSQSIEKG